MKATKLTDARNSKRRTVLNMALIRIGDMSANCVVRNLTDAGAALDISSQGAIPDQFTLIVVATKEIYSCNVVWRKNRRIGVSFC